MHYLVKAYKLSTYVKMSCLSSENYTMIESYP